MPGPFSKSGRGDDSPRPASRANSKTAMSPPLIRRRRGDAQVPLCGHTQYVAALHTASVPDGAPPQWAERGATPWLAVAGCANARRPQCWRFVTTTSRQRFTDAPPSLAMELPHHASSMPPQDAAGAGAFALSVKVVGLASIEGQANEAVRRGCRVGPVSLRSSRPMRPWLVVNPDGGTAVPWASWPQPSGTNNFPCAVTAFGAFLAGQILCASRSSTAFRPQAVRPAHPPPDGSQQGRDGRDLG